MHERSHTGEGELRLNVLCEREGKAFRVHVDPAFVPPYLRTCLDVHGEAFPVLLDLEELSRCQNEAPGTIEERRTRLGSLELIGRSGGTDALARFLVTSIASGVRRPGPSDASNR
jgi:hypothetical protein